MPLRRGRWRNASESTGRAYARPPPPPGRGDLAQDQVDVLGHDQGAGLGRRFGAGDEVQLSASPKASATRERISGCTVIARMSGPSREATRSSSSALTW